MTRWSSRSDWDAQPPRNVRDDVDPVGVAVHWSGGGSYARDSHDSCLDLVRGWQDQHMADPNVNDVFYNLFACHHGYLIEARSTRSRPVVRGGANGTASSNSSWYSLQAIWGAGDGPPADELLTTVRDGIDWLRTEAGAGNRLSGHRDHVPTECPGDDLYAWVQAGASRPEGDDDMPTPRKLWTFRGVDYVNEKPSTKNHQVAAGHRDGFRIRRALFYNGANNQASPDSVRAGVRLIDNPLYPGTEQNPESGKPEKQQRRASWRYALERIWRWVYWTWLRVVMIDERTERIEARLDALIAAQDEATQARAAELVAASARPTDVAALSADDPTEDDPTDTADGDDTDADDEEQA